MPRFGIRCEDFSSLREFNREWMRRYRAAGAVRTTRRHMDARGFPVPFRGCWSSKSWRRRYHRAWWRAHSAPGSELRRVHAARQAARVANSPALRRKHIRACRRWRKENAESHRAQARKAYWTKRRKVCFFCGRAGKPGRGGAGALKKIERLLLLENGREVTKMVLCCKGCR